MPKLFSGREVVQRLKRIGYVIISQKGSHIKLRGVKEGKLRTVIVPNHRQIALGDVEFYSQTGQRDEERIGRSVDRIPAPAATMPDQMKELSVT